MKPYHPTPSPYDRSANAIVATADAAAKALASHRRIVLVLIAIALMGVADLLFTLTYMTGPGMMEINPLARTAIAIGGTSMLIRFKLFTILLSAGILYCCRRHRSAELWTWFCAGVMFALTLHWVHYNATISDLTQEVATIAANRADAPPQWIHIASTGT